MIVTRRVALCILALVALSLPACGGQRGKMRLAFVSNNAHGFWTYAQRGCQKAAKELDVDLEFQRPDPGTAARQQRMIEDLLVTGVQGIAVSPNDPENSVNFFKDKVLARIPLIAQDNDLPNPEARSCYIGTDNYRAGRAAGALVKRAIPKGGKIVIFVGRSDSPNAIERRQGVLDFLAGKEQTELQERTPFAAQNVKVGDYVLLDTRTDIDSEPTCQKMAEEMLVLHKDIACMIGLWEYNPPAIIRAVKAASYKPAIVAFDENFDTLKGIQDGDVAGTVVQNPFMFGYESIRILHGLVKKDPNILKRKDIDSKNRIYVPHRVIVRNPGPERIGDSETIDVDIFYPETKKLRGEG